MQYCTVAIIMLLFGLSVNSESLYILSIRFANDLLQWEPASPAAVEKATARSMFYSCMDMLQPAVSNQDKFKLCKSVLEDGKRQ